MIERVSFEVAGDTVVGDLHRPAGGGRRPALVVAGPMTSVKEQVTGVYAAALAERGFLSLALDHRGYGESGGEPRQYEDWRRKVEDLRTAVDWLGTRPDVDPDARALVGVCLGAGYAAHAAVDDPAVKALGLVVGYYRDPDAMRAADPAGFDAKVAQGRVARERWEATGVAETVPAVALSGDAAMSTPELHEYYGTPRAGVPYYVNAFAVMSRELFLPFDVQAAATRIRVPVAMVHSEKALSPHWARKFHDALTVPKRLEWLPSNGQVDFYDDAALVARSAEIVAAHLAKVLTSLADG